MMKLVALLLLVAVGVAWAQEEGGLTEEDFENAKSVTSEGAEASPDEYNPGLFEGDIANPIKDGKKAEEFMKQGGGLGRNALRNRNQLWPNGRVPYIISSAYDSKSRAVIAAAMADYHKNTCIRWVPKSYSDKNYIHIKPLDGCYSMVGTIGGEQTMSLKMGNPGCIQKGIIIHEMMHAVGFMHEQSRTDRDQYIDIDWDNIPKDMHSQFEKYGQDMITHLGTKYDYGSIMHYGKHAFSSNGKQTIHPRSRSTEIGQRTGFSQNDIYKINTLYGCPGGGETTPKPCFDREKRPTACSGWKRAGWCSKADLKDQMIHFCEKTCGFCS